MKISLVAAKSMNGVIGLGGHIPWHSPDDLEYFKSVTVGKPVIMGRTTYESIGKPLPGRTNIVVSRKFKAKDFPPGVTVFSCLEDALCHCEVRNTEEVMIIGGATLYNEALSKGLVDRLYLNIIGVIVLGDTYFPNFDSSKFNKTTELLISSETGPDICCRTYEISNI